MNETMPHKIMTQAEIEAEYENEWVLVEDPELDRSNEVIKGKVLFHSKNRDEVYQKAIELRPKRSAFLYTGPIPDNIFVNL